MTPRTVVAFFCMAQHGHFRRLLPLVSALRRHDRTAHVFTHRQFAREVESCGAHFVDLFAERAVPEVDAASTPAPLRYLGFAADLAADLAGRVARLRPALVVYDSFALIGRAVGHRLGIPYVNVCAGHAVYPARLAELLPTIPPCAPSPHCLEAARRLSEQLAIAEGDPFSYLCAPSPFLNVYCEPPEFLTAAERAAFEPIAFFGSIDPARGTQTTGGGAAPFSDAGPGVLKIYVSFGTVNWRYWPAEMAAALHAIAEDIGTVADAEALISLGGHDDADGAFAGTLRRRNVRVERYVDQWRVLQDADAFVTHHGLNSTHEAIFQRVPMVSYPFLWDQPGLARACQQLGLALPLAERPRAPLRAGRMGAVLTELRVQRAAMVQRLAIAREWEERVVAERAAVVQRILALL
jgi:UDP:flavonoid glycosyltransferase YjiC (YdhE family)